MAGGDAFLGTRVSLLAERLLRRPQRQALVTGTAEQITPLLQRAGLQALVSDPPRDARGLEQALASALVAEALALIHGMNSRQADFLRHWMRRLELVNLKLVLRAKLAGLSAAETLKDLLDLGPLTTLPVHALANSDSAQELLRRLENSPYAAMARQVRRNRRERPDLFDAEATLDVHYFHQLAHKARALGGAAGKLARQLLGRWLDQVNLASLLRFRLVYGLEAPHAFFLLAPGGHLLHPGLLQQLARQDSLERMLALLPPTLRQALAGVSDIEGLEYRMVARVRSHARKLLRQRNPGMARAFAWLYLREQQIQLIHTVLKGRLLGLDPALVQFCADPLLDSRPPAAGARP